MTNARNGKNGSPANATDVVQARTICDALDLMLGWAGCQERVQPLPGPPDLPPALMAVIAASDALGPQRGPGDRSACTLLDAQDRICRPAEMRKDENGILPLVIENQGVWEIGFSPLRPETALVRGDWIYGDLDLDHDTWSPSGLSCEAALTLSTLINGFFALSRRFALREEPDFDQVPNDTPLLFWTHDALGAAWQGMWTDAGHTRLHFGGFGHTLLRTHRT